jgi:hypothetical protein
MALLTGFVSTRPPYVMTQAHSLDWLAKAHAQSEAALIGLSATERENFAGQMARVIGRVGCSPASIATRGSVLPDFTTCERDGSSLNLLYDDPCAPAPRFPHGRGASTRIEIYGRAVDAYFARLYADEAAPPDDLIHVTCTGYRSPSGAQ